ncbi:MAG: hypothetical protein JNN32_08600 [Flavobacteriales bacterium]|nr:hypothetical protein [Flavobacteriales bacterium]
MITHDLLDAYEAVKGEYEKLPWGKKPDEQLWETVDEILLDLHLIKHGYASDGYERHIERKLKEVCADLSVAERMRALRI